MDKIKVYSSLWAFIWALIVILLICSCSPTKKAQRKLRRANRLMTEAKGLSPGLFDTVYVVKKDTVVLTRDSLVTNYKIVQDSSRIDSLILLYNKLRAEKADPEIIRRTVIEKFVPDLVFESTDSLMFVLDKKEKYLLFKIRAELENSEISITTKPLSDIEYTREEQHINIDANRSRFYQDIYFWVFLLFVGIILVIRYVIKKYIEI